MAASVEEPGAWSCPADSLPPGRTAKFRLSRRGKTIEGFVINSNGRYHAYVNRCPHAGHPLDLVPGRFLTSDGQAILCSSHAARFTPLEGLCFDGPCPGQMLQPVPVDVRDGAVWLSATFDAASYQP